MENIEAVQEFKEGLCKETLERVSFYSLCETLKGDVNAKRKIYDILKAGCVEDTKPKQIMEQWARVCEGFYEDDHTASKTLLGHAFQQFVNLVIQHGKQPITFTFKNASVKGRAMYFGVHVTIIKEAFLLWLQCPELFSYPHVSRSLSNALNAIIKPGEHSKFLFAFDSEKVSDKFLNTCLVSAGFDFSSGVKCMLASVRFEEGYYTWHPRQYVGVKDCLVTKGGLELFRIFVQQTNKDKELYEAGIAYYSDKIK